MTPRLLTGFRRMAWGLCGQLLIALPASGAPTAGEKAAAEALFQEGSALMAEKNFNAACAKFEASHAIEPGLGIKLFLADCYDREGRSASAWALFKEAAALAQQSSQPEREQVANERAVELQRRLSKLELKPPHGGLPPGTIVTLNGVAIPAASLGSALPVDPGAQRVLLQAPGYRELTLETKVPVGPASVVLEVPPLEREPKAVVSRPAERRLEPAPTPGGTQRTLGYALGGLGVLSLAGSGVLAYQAHALDADSHKHCLANEPNACDKDGVSLRGKAQTYGNVATGVFSAGAALSVTGLVLLLTAPSAQSDDKKVRVGARVTPDSATLVVGGRL